MVMKNSKPTRIDIELDEILKKISEDDDLSMRQASRKLAREIKRERQKTIKF